MRLVGMVFVFFFVFCFTFYVSAASFNLSLEYATNFKIRYLTQGYKLVIDGMGRKILLVPRGKRNMEFPFKDFDTLVYIPVRKTVVRWTTIPPLLKVLGVVSSVVGVTAPKKDWYVKEIREGMEKKRIFYIGEYKSINYELLRALKPDLFFAGEWENVGILKEINLPFAVVCEYRELHPLGRLEWIKFFGAFYNKDKRAEEYFNEVVKRVKKTVQKVSNYHKRPKVLWGFVTSNGLVYVPKGKSYVAKMIEMAGGDYVFKGLNFRGVAPITLEEFYKRGKDADIYISTGTLPNYGITSIKKFLERHPMLYDLKPIREGKVWCFQPWYWQSIDKTDEIIEDLAFMFHPDILPRHKVRFFLRLPQK